MIVTGCSMVGRDARDALDSKPTRCQEPAIFENVYSTSEDRWLHK